MRTRGRHQPDVFNLVVRPNPVLAPGHDARSRRRHGSAGARPYAAQIAELEATRKRLRDDRKAGLYDDADDAEWYRTEYKRIGEEITAHRALPERKPGIRVVGTGRTIAQEWGEADGARRREILTEFEVRVVLHPLGHAPRVAVTGMEIPEGYELTE